MAFAPTPSWFFLLLMFVVPAIAVVATVVCIPVSLHSRWVGRGTWWPVPMHRRWYAGFTLLVLCDGWVLLLVQGGRNLDAAIASESANRAARAEFVLLQDVQHGELLFPSGTWIKRYDPFDNGEPVRALKLTGLEQAHFSKPLDIAGVVAVSLDFSGGAQATVELAHDQRVRGTECKKGQMALFSVPPIDYDIVAEFGKEAPDGPDARFKPGQWKFDRCTGQAVVLDSPTKEPRL